MSDLPRVWPLVNSQYGPDLVICRARFDTLTNPRTGKDMQRTVLETPEWCNVVALTREGRLVVVRQFRFGSAKVTTEIPGGVVDPGEEHGDAARRELREECGYTSERWSYLGCVEPNPAFHDNLCHHWLATGCTKVAEHLELDAGEDIVVCVEKLERVKQRVRAGEIRHVLVQSALQRVVDLFGVSDGRHED